MRHREDIDGLRATAVLSVVYHAPRFHGVECLVERRREVSRQVVHHHANSLRPGVMYVDEIAHAFGKVATCSTGR
jgi:hypothetical protein